ncbi:Unknown protein [Striga hermonthica]|uniref:DUF1985 domain-containing protein n=1 Tax=Striga hermonthica TaxID=68872 RepID=A0A9N7RJ54_STRHE|nr:Unknown protein [Striga hermonthica]
MTSPDNNWKWRWDKACNWIGKVNCHMKPLVIRHIKQRLSSNCLAEFERSCFGHFLKFHDNSYNSGKLLLSLFGREVEIDNPREKECYYRIGGRNHKFGKEEFCAITRLRFGNSDFDPDTNKSLPPANGVYRRYFDGKTVLGRDLLSKFVDRKFEEDDALKVAFILVVFFFILSPDSRMSVPMWWWTLVENTTEFERFPWGSYAFQRLHHYLENGIRPPVGGGEVQFNICGYIMALQGDNLPRGARWTCGKVPFNGANELDIAEIPYSPMVLTAEEKNASYMADINRDLSSNIQYIHRDQWASSCQPLSSAKMHGRGLKTMRPSNKTHSANNLEFSEEDEHIPPAKRRAHDVEPERPHPVAFDRPSASSTVDEAKIEDVVSKKIEEAFARMLPRFVDSAVSEDDLGKYDLGKDDLRKDDLVKGEESRQEREHSNQKSDFVPESGDHVVSGEDVVDEDDGIAKVGPSQDVAAITQKPTKGGGFTDGDGDGVVVGRTLRVKFKNSKLSSPFIDYREKKTEKQLKVKYENWKKKKSPMACYRINGKCFIPTILNVRRAIQTSQIMRVGMFLRVWLVMFVVLLFVVDLLGIQIPM